MDREQVLTILSEIKTGIVEVEYLEDDIIDKRTIYEVCNGKIAIIGDTIEYKYENGCSVKKLKHFIRMGYETDMKCESRKIRWGAIEKYYDIKKDLGFKNINVLMRN